MKVAIIGASDDPSRFSYKAFRSLMSYGHDVYLVSPKYQQIGEHKVYKTIAELPSGVETFTMYVNKRISSQLEEEILRYSPKRVIFNPGAENSDLKKKIEDQQIQAVDSCTLVMLRAGSF